MENAVSLSLTSTDANATSGLYFLCYLAEVCDPLPAIQTVCVRQQPAPYRNKEAAIRLDVDDSVGHSGYLQSHMEDRCYVLKFTHRASLNSNKNISESVIMRCFFCASISVLPLNVHLLVHLHQLCSFALF